MSTRPEPPFGDEDLFLLIGPAKVFVVVCRFMAGNIVVRIVTVVIHEAIEVGVGDFGKKFLA